MQSLWRYFGSGWPVAALPIALSVSLIGPAAAVAGIAVLEDASIPTQVVEEPPVVIFGPGPEQPPCDPVNAVSEHSRALLMGAGRVENWVQITGHINDVSLLSDVLEQKDVQVTSVVDPTIDRIFSELQSLIDTTGCGDTVLLHLTGLAFTDSDIETLLRQRDYDPVSGGNRQRPESKIAFLGVDAANADIMMPMSSLGLRDIDLASAVTVLRNRGAFVFVSLDVPFAQTFRLVERTGDDDLWELSAAGNTGGARLPALNANAGGMAVFYGTDELDWGIETRLPLTENGAPRSDARSHGGFSYSLAMAIAGSERDVSIRELAERTRQTIDNVARGMRRAATSSFVTTDPQWQLLAPRAPVPRNPEPSTDGDSRALNVTMISPPATRGLLVTRGEPIVIEGRLGDTAGLVSLLVNQTPVGVSGDGYFRLPVAPDPSAGSLQLVGLYEDASSGYRTRVSEIEYEYEDLLAGAADAGRRFALLVGNQQYTDASRYTALRTPHNDVARISQLLTELYGFETSIEVNGNRHDLVLTDAGGNEILSILDMLRRNLSENDTLLVYYAGHGYYLEEMDEAYWVPIDAQAGELFSLIPADDITRQLRMMNARHVLVISDSCYSGGLIRSGGELDIGGPDMPDGRDNYLRALLERRSRALLSSGSNEPVWDGGGGGNHSVFAAALIRGLTEMRGETFTAEELYSRYLKETVAGSSEQVPQYQFLQNSGHDGGGFLFFGAGRE